MKKIVLSVMMIGLAFCGFAQSDGLTNEQLNKIKKSYQENAQNKLLRNLISNNDIKKLATNNDNNVNFDANFSNRVNNKGITDQKQSGRCWMFSGLNVLRSKMIAQYNLGEFSFSQNHLFFYDQLEKSNMFLSLIIKYRNEDLTSKNNEWLLKNVLSDGGTFCGIIDLVNKYGLVPSTIKPETFNSNNTSHIDDLITLKLKEDALTLRDMSKSKASISKLNDKKIEMLSEIYKMLVFAYGEPITEFTYTMRDCNNKVISTDKYTPKSFFDKYVNKKLDTTFVMFMNDPTRDYYKLYEIENDRHTMDGHNWRYINLPIEDIKDIAIKSIKDSTMMYFSCDVGKFYNNANGTLDLNNFDYGSIMGVSFNMDKKQRISTFASGSSHAMTLCAVDLDANNKPIKWMVENSWGKDAGYQGHLIMTDKWFNEYMFRLVAEKKYVSEKILNILNQKPIILPAWDPMFLEDVD